MRSSRVRRRVLGSLPVVLLALFAGVTQGVLGLCGPFTDVAADAFCPFVLEVFYLGITTGTTATTYDPASNVSRLQMAAFLSRTVDRTLQRSNRRAALKQFWRPQDGGSLGITTIGPSFPRGVESDGADLWVANLIGSVSRVRASDGKLLETWTGAGDAFGVLVARGRVFVTGNRNPGELYQIDPSQPAGAVTTVVSSMASAPLGIAFDGSRIWTAASSGAVSIVTPGATIPWTVTTVTTGFATPIGVLYDGANVWVLDGSVGLLKLDGSGAILQTVTLGSGAGYPVFDGTSIWAPNNVTNSVAVVRASNGSVLATLTGNGLLGPMSAAFDGQRVLVTNFGGNSVSLWKAADLTTLGSLTAAASAGPYGACSDGVNFWLTLYTAGQLARF